MQVYIAGQRVQIAQDSLSVEDAIGERSTCSFLVIDKHKQYRFHKGQQVQVIDRDGEIIFSGVIDTPKEQERDAMFHSIQCSDWHYLADKRVLAEVYVDTQAGGIVRHIIEKYLADEGVSKGNVQDGPMVNEARFNWVPVSAALDSLAEKAGYWWLIDHDKRLHFVARETHHAPWVATGGDMAHSSIVVEESNPHYRNRQYIKGGRDVTDPLTETRKADGVAKTFALGYPVAKVLAIEISPDGQTWVPQTVGIKMIESGRQWYWSKGDRTIVQDDSDEPLPAEHYWRIHYQGEFDVIAISENRAEITGRQAIEGTSGVVEDVADEPQSTNRDAAFQSANAKLRQYGVIGRRLVFRTKRKGLAPGQLLSVSLPSHRIDSELLVESVSIDTEGPVVWYGISAVEGPPQGSWAKVFHHMATRGQAFVIRENISEDQILISLAQFSRIWQSTDPTPNIFKPSNPGVGLKPGFSPAFLPANRVRYLAWLDANQHELGRKRVSKQVGADELLSITYLAPFEANGVQIEYLAWIGGWQASEKKGTGIRVDVQQYAKTKTELEAVQVDKMDIKGW